MTRVPGRHLVIVGPTASGKSSVAMALAERRTKAGQAVEILSADSMQVYRGMDIGTAKSSAHDQELVRHHLIDVVDPTEEFSVAQFAVQANMALDEIESRGARAIIVGGTGLYIQALTDGLNIPGRFREIRSELEQEPSTEALFARLGGLDPSAASRTDPANRRRIIRALEVTLGSGRPFSSFGPGLDAYPPTKFALAGIRIDRALLAVRIEERFDQQMTQGFLSEARELAALGVGLSRTAAQALGYRELMEHVRGPSDLDGAVHAAIIRTRQFAVRQIRWFRRDPRIEWFDHVGDPLQTLDAVDRYWQAWN